MEDYNKELEKAYNIGSLGLQAMKEIADTIYLPDVANVDDQTKYGMIKVIVDRFLWEVEKQ